MARKKGAARLTGERKRKRGCMKEKKQYRKDRRMVRMIRKRTGNPPLNRTWKQKSKNGRKPHPQIWSRVGKQSENYQESNRDTLHKRFNKKKSLPVM